MRLENKVALISGGARGMGAVEAKLFTTEGAKVVIGDVLEEDGRRTEAEINEAGGECLFVPLDVTNEAAWQDAVQAAVRRFGKLDILVNNAGIYRTERVEEVTEELWDLVMGINAKGVFLGTKHAIPEMRKLGGGSIINVSSIYGIVGSPTSTAYHAAKGAIRLFTKSAAIQYAKENIRVNSVHPGYARTPLTTASYDDPERYQWVLDRTPMGRVGDAYDIAYGILYLASDESSFVTGSELVIDGGMTAQ